MSGNSSLHTSDLGLDWHREEQVLDVLDLPQLYQKPSCKRLLDTLSLLSYEPPSWEGTPPPTSTSNTPLSTSGANTPARRRPKVRSEGVPQYLTRIISSRLAWIADDEEKELVWDAASVRLSERSGRTGMGAISRCFRIPTTTGPAGEVETETYVVDAEDDSTFVDIAIHEPALTEDNLGLKTWASSYVLAKMWCTLKPSLPRATTNTSVSTNILELGAGTGLVGMAAAAVLSTNVLLTDLPDIVPNLTHNISANAIALTARGGSAKAAILDWTVPEKIVYPPQNPSEAEDPNRSELVAEVESSKYPLVVAADPIYSKEQPAWLVQTIECHLERSEDARVVIILPIRDAFASERADFRARMRDIGLVICDERTETGYDDWSEGRGEELAEVECWMSIWRWIDECSRT